MYRAARTLARLVRAASRRSGRTGGTTAPGRMLLRIAPGSMRSMAKELEAGSMLLSATNGKTTTAAMVAAILDRGGRRLVHNRAGANMAGGVATALMDGDGDPIGRTPTTVTVRPRCLRVLVPR